ncbi:MAG: DUF4292 domain-containing protein [bacterium]|nr:DUF4292 domain-containing protein [bacterium]
MRSAFRRQSSPILLLSLSLLFFACATGRPPLPDAGLIQNPAELLSLIASQSYGLQDQKIRAKIDLEIDGIKERRATARVLHRAPGDLKLDIGTFGIVFLSALVQNDTLRLHLPRENHYLEGPPEEVLYRITGVDLSYYTLNRAILGLPTLTPLDLPRITRYDVGQTQIILEIRDPLWTRRVVVDRRTATVQEEHIFDTKNDRRLSSRRLTDYRFENGFTLPRRIEILQNDNRNRIRIEIDRREINTGLSQSDFQMKVPSDVIRH